jgi:hypothetical protein
MHDLWPEITSLNAVRSPVVILREQAALLGQKTNNIVQASVSGESKSNLFWYHFYIVAPALNNYHYKLMRIHHGIDLYPAYFHLDSDVYKEIGEQFKTTDFEGSTDESHIMAGSETEFIDILRLVFNSKKTIQVITFLMSQLADPLFRSAS